MGRLDITIIEARNLPNAELLGKPHPYVTISVADQLFKTSVVTYTRDPKWDQEFHFTVADPASAQIELKIWSKNSVVADGFIGQYRMSLTGLKKGEVKDTWVLVHQCKSTAEIRLKIVAHDFGIDPNPISVASAIGQPQQLPGWFQQTQFQNAPYIQQQQQQQQQQQVPFAGTALQQQQMMMMQHQHFQQQQMYLLQQQQQQQKMIPTTTYSQQYPQQNIQQQFLLQQQQQQQAPWQSNLQYQYPGHHQQGIQHHHQQQLLPSNQQFGTAPPPLYSSQPQQQQPSPYPGYRN